MWYHDNTINYFVIFDYTIYYHIFIDVERKKKEEKKNLEKFTESESNRLRGKTKDYL